MNLDHHRMPVAAIFGPTAVGKSAVSLTVAADLDAEIVSADSMQIYRGLPVLTDQPPAEMLGAVPHHLVGSLPLAEEYSAGRFSRDARRIIQEINTRGRLTLLVGGTGLYTRALLGGLSLGPPAEGSERQRWEDFLKERGPEAAYAELSRLDPDAAEAVDRRNPRRLIRALEAASTDGNSRERGRLWSRWSPFRILCFGLELPRKQLYRRIDARVDAMLASGAIEEVKNALAGEVSRTAAQAIGFDDIAAYLRGAVSLEEAAAAIRQKSRRFAKRQQTWMRKMPDVVRIDLDRRTPAQAAQEIAGRIREAGLTTS